MLLAAIQSAQPFIPTWASQAGYQLRPFIAELILTGTIVAVLLSAFKAKRSNTLAGLVALVGVVAALIGLLAVQPLAAGTQLRGMLVSDNLAVMWKVMLLIFTGGIILMWFSSTGGLMHEGDGPEFFTLLLGATLGMCLMGSTSNLLMIFLAMEMASLPSYVLAGFRKTHPLGSEASLKYVVFGAATSAIMVYGLSMLYGLYGTLQLDQLAPHLTSAGGVPLILALAGILVGLGFKISIVPLHFWCPDVFEGAGIDVSAFLSVASKGAALTLLLRILMTIAGSLGYGHSEILTSLSVVIGVIGSITCTVGNTAAYVQNNIKRLLAYSSIAHAGYMVCVLSLLVQGQASGQTEPLARVAAQAILFYLAIYLFMNLGAFSIAALIYRQTGSENINDYAGMGRRNPLLAACLSACLFSLVGVPPFAGFAAKFNVLLALFNNGGWYWILVVVIGVNTIFSLYYYLRVIRVMYLSDDGRPAVRANPLGSALGLACAVMLVVLMLFGFGPLTKLTQNYSSMYTANERALVDRSMSSVVAVSGQQTTGHMQQTTDDKRQP